MPADPLPQNFDAAFEALREQLACPVCYGALRLENAQLICLGCGRSYPVVHGIPVLIADSESRSSTIPAQFPDG